MINEDIKVDCVVIDSTPYGRIAQVSLHRHNVTLLVDYDLMCLDYKKELSDRDLIEIHNEIMSRGLLKY